MIQESNNKILITGGAGYLGSSLVNYLESLKYNLIIFDNLSQNNHNIVKEKSKKITLVQADINNAEKLKKHIEGVGTVIHLAGTSDGKSGEKNPKLTIKNNLTPFLNLIEESKKNGVKKFIFTSTFGVYGHDYRDELREDLEPNPCDIYSITKLQCEKILKEQTNDTFKAITLRSSMIHGLSPRMRFDFIVNYLSIKALVNKKIKIINGSQTRPLIHIKDISKVISYFIKQDFKYSNYECYNIHENNYSIKDIADIISKRLKNIEIEYVNSMKKENSFILNSDKIKFNYDLKFGYDLKYGINQILNHYKNKSNFNFKDVKYYNGKLD
tara:strand:+ start:1457 stop:2437 length:981 start_codon:yes stop_codon:yes gene_type:complete